MNHKLTRWVVLTSLVVLALLTWAGVTLAQKTGAPQAPSYQNLPQVDLGQAGLSYRYVQTYGETQVPYFADTTHLNSPVGLFMDSSDNLYVTEDWGFRVLKYDSTPSNVLVLGKAGSSAWTLGWNENLLFGPHDVALDNSGNIWIADANRVVQYDASGVYLQQLPDDPWNSGDDNTHFNDVWGIAFDTAGRMFVSDTNNQRVQVYDLTSGSPVYSTTLGVTGESGSDNSHFNQPWRIALDSLNQLYVADSANGRVQKCAYASGWSCAPLDTGLNMPQGLTVDSSDHVYIADTDNSRIRKCISGTCSDFATDTPGFTDLAVDSGGNVYGTVSWDVYAVFKYDSTGLLVGTYIGEQGVPYLTDAYHYNLPLVSTDAEGNILITEEFGHRLVKLDPDGNFLWSFGEPGVSGWDQVHLNSPMRVAADSGGNIYVPDRWACRVQIISPTGHYSNTLGTGCGTGDYEFNAPMGVAIDNVGNVYVADQGNQRVMIYDPNLVYIDRIGETGVCNAANDHLCQPMAVAVDSAGNIYVTDSGNNRVQKFNSGCQWQMTLGDGTSGNQFDQFASPQGITVDAQGKIFVSDAWNQRVQVFDSTGAYLTTIGGAWGTNSAQFIDASSVALDSAGNIYASDVGNSRIQVYAPGVPGWKQVNINGFGDPNNLEISRFSVFGNYLYASADNNQTGGEMWRSSNGSTWTRVILGGLGNANNNRILEGSTFNGYLYVGTSNSISGAELWRCAVCDGLDWQKVTDGGFGDSHNIAMEHVVELSGTLYVTLNNETTGAEVWKSLTGNPGDWTQSNVDGFGDPKNFYSWAVAVFNGRLYIATGQVDGWTPSSTWNTEVWRSTNSGGWEEVSPNGFGSDRNIGNSLATFHNQLYLNTGNLHDGSQIWRCTLCDGSDWEHVGNAPFGANVWIAPLIAYQDAFYASTMCSWSVPCDGASIWKSLDGVNWSQIASQGFGDSNNAGSFGRAVFNNQLFFGTYNGANGGEIWQYVGFPIYLPLVRK